MFNINRNINRLSFAILNRCCSCSLVSVNIFIGKPCVITSLSTSNLLQSANLVTNTTEVTSHQYFLNSPLTKANLQTKFFENASSIIINDANVYQSRCYSSLPIEDNIEPTSIVWKKKENVLVLEFGERGEFRYSAEFLRVYSPAATSPSFILTIFAGINKVVDKKRDVAIIGLEPIGNYALQITFDDLHEDGIYSWKYLLEIGMNKYTLMKKYLRSLQQAGKSRNPQKVSKKTTSNNSNTMTSEQLRKLIQNKQHKE